MRYLWPLLLAQGWRSFLANGVVPSLLSFACLAYTNGASILQYASVASNILGPLAALSNKWVRLDRRIGLLMAICTVAHGYIIVVACLHRAPLWGPAGAGPGGVLVVAANIVASVTSAYCSTLIFLNIQDPEMHVGEGYTALTPTERAEFVSMGSELAGLAIQVFAMVGSFLMFGVSLLPLFSSN